MKRIGTSNGKSRSRSQLHSCVIWYYLRPNSQCCTEGSIACICRFFKAINEVQVETTTMEAFGETIPGLVETVDIKILRSVHNKLVKPTLQPVQEGITGVTLHCLFKNKPVSVRPNKVLLPDPPKVRFEVTRLDFLGRLWSEIPRHVAKLLQFILVSCSCSFILFEIIDAGFPPELAENANGIFSFGQRLNAFTVRTLEPWTPRLFSRFFVIVQSQAHFISRGTHFIYVELAKSLVRAEKSPCLSNFIPYLREWNWKDFRYNLKAGVSVREGLFPSIPLTSCY